MAERVQDLLEQMLPELEDIERKQIFTREEVQRIMKRRTRLEYLVNRRIARREDFLRYIQYEMNVEALRRRRKRKQGAHKISLSDRTGIQRIHSLFRRALMKFPSDLRMWLQYIDFSVRTGAENSLSRTFARGLQLHPRCAGLWIKAASWEYEANSNVNASRVLFQRGLRINPDSERIWHEYFRMEVLYLLKIRERRKIVGLDKKTTDSSIDTSVLPQAPPEGHGATMTMPEVEEAVGRKAYLEGSIPTVVFMHACRAIPRSVDFRMGFLAICKGHEGLLPVEDKIYESLVEDFPEEPSAKRILAEREISRAPDRQSGVERAVALFEREAEAVDTPSMWEAYVDWCHACIEKHVAENAEDTTQPALVGVLLNACSRAIQREHVTPSIFRLYVFHLLRMGRVRESTEILEAATTAFPSHVDLWLQRIQLVIRLEEVSQTDKSSLVSRIRALHDLALQHVSPSESHSLWFSLADFLILSEEKDEVVEDVFSRAIKRTTDSVSLKRAFVSWAFQLGGIEKARSTITLVLQHPPTPMSVLSACIAIETSLEVIDVRRVESLFEHAVTNYGTVDWHVWIDYIFFERSQGRFAYANKLYWRALKMLSDTDAFVEAHATQL